MAALPSISGQEVILPGEDAAIQQIVEVCNELLETASRPVPRQQHGRGHGVVRATFRVSANVPPDLRHGIFREPGEYPALVRFSNGGERNESGKDAHGMAIKLFGVRGTKVLDDERDAETQDFVLLDSPAFFIRDAVEYAVFARALRAAVHFGNSGMLARAPEKLRKLGIIGHLFWNYLRQRPYERKKFLGVRRKPPVTGLHGHYWSTTPYSLGPHAVHWSARSRAVAPTIEELRTLDRSGSPEFKLHRGLSTHLARHDATFDFLAQRQTDPARMSVEDATIPWSETESPPVVLATLEIPRQEWNTERRNALSEQLSFTPWHSLPEHRPLGSINRARRHIYLALARRRRELNGVAQVEPDLAWLSREWDGGGAGSLPQPATHGAQRSART